MDRQYFEILSELEKHHALFGQFWSVGRLVENEAIPTACITFDQYGDGLQFQINPKFWASLDLYTQTFVIAHECLHVYLEHGRRMKHMQKDIANIAADVVDNHYLLDGFGFERDKVNDWAKYCWLDTVFKGDKTVRPHESLEYYYQILMKDAQKQHPQYLNVIGGGKGENSTPQTVDGHENLEGLAEEILEKIVGKLSQEELESFEQIAGEQNQAEQNAAAQQAGSTAGSLSKIIKLGRIIKKRKWETVVQDVLGRFIGRERDVTFEQWAHQNRRLAGFPRGDLMLPSDLDDVIPVRDKIDVWFFQDTSGSCVSLAERFFKAAATIPEDKFRVRMFCFDTRVYETTLKSGKLYGFGGTSFSCIEQHIQSIIKTEKGCEYPSVVFLVTDGYGDNVNPQFADRWHFFLSEHHSVGYIPKKSKRYKLVDFE